MEDTRLKIGIKVSKITMFGNIVLSVIKLLIGFLGKSTAMIADGIHSLSDVITTVGVIVGFNLSSKPADKEHQYGHEKIESIVSLFLAIILFLVAIGIGFSGIKTIFYSKYSIPEAIAILGAILSIVAKEWMYWYTIKYAKKLNSPSLKADAWHHRSDSLSSIGALVGIVGAKLGLPLLDPLAALVISLVIVKVSYDILKQSIYQLIDHCANDAIISDIKSKIKNIEGVNNIDLLKTRLHANKIYVDVEISVDKSLTVEEGHSIAANVHRTIEKDKQIKHCMVHVNPSK